MRMGIRHQVGFVIATLSTAFAMANCGATKQGSPPAKADPGEGGVSADGAFVSTDGAAYPVVTGDVEPKITALFVTYAKYLNDHELVKSLELFAPAFIVASPGGNSVVVNDEARRAVVAKEDDYYKNTLKMTSSHMISIRQTSLHGHHYFVRVEWGCTFEKTGDKVTSFPLAFIVDNTQPKPKILTHVVEADEPAIFRSLGLIR